MLVMAPVHSKVERIDCKRVRKGKEKKKTLRDWNFPGPVVKNPPANAREMGLITGRGRFPMQKSN